MTHHKHAPTLKDELAAKKLMAPPVTTPRPPFPPLTLTRNRWAASLRSIPLKLNRVLT